MNDKRKRDQVVLIWSIKMGLASKYENLDTPLTKREFLRILYKLFNKDKK